MNACTQLCTHLSWLRHPASILALTAILAACGPTIKKNLIYETTVTLPAGRFTGPIEVEVPRMADHADRDFEIHVEMLATCGPQLRVAYQDGESFRIGSDDESWQELLAERAEANVTDESHPPTDTDAKPPDSANPDEPVDPYDSPATQPIDPYAGSPATQPDAPNAGPAATQPSSSPSAGHWRQVVSESWPGQLEFMRRRDSRCASQKRYTRRYITGYDETGKMAFWADVPQEVGGGQVRIQIFERIDVKAENRAAAKRRQQQAKQRAARAQAAEAKITTKVVVKPPRPEPRVEKPMPAKAEGARWVSGHWTWYPGRGEWVWIRGHWGRPVKTPPGKVENHGQPPIAGCTWQSGYWVWVKGPGRWKWNPGHWNPPPPKTESPGTPPVPESPWIAGRWIRTGVSFTWKAGYWGKPVPRKETIPPPPFNGATWRPGIWIKLKGKWTWSPGFYEDSAKPPPPRKRETPGAKPHRDAVWLAGYWRWNSGTSAYQWVAGHWELPPGEGYVWVPDPPDPQVGFSITGQWKLRIDVKGPVKRRRR